MAYFFDGCQFLMICIFCFIRKSSKIYYKLLIFPFCMLNIHLARSLLLIMRVFTEFRQISN